MRAVYATKPQYQKMADSLLTTLAQERHYYGWLAAEAMQKAKIGYRQQPKPVDEALVKQVASEYKVQRAVALHQSGVHRPARKAWYAAIKGYSRMKSYLRLQLPVRGLINPGCWGWLGRKVVLSTMLNRV